MKNRNKRIIILIGKTHSGKTTFAKRLEKIDKNILLIEGDPIELFLKSDFARLKNIDEKRYLTHKGNSLLHKIFSVFFNFALETGQPIILSNANIWRGWRKKVIKLARKFDYKIIGVYFDLSNELLLKRISKTKKTTKVIREAINFRELLINQSDRIQIPKETEFDEFYIVKSEKDLRALKNRLI